MQGAGDGLGGRDQRRPAATSCDGGLDLGGEPAVGAGAGSAGGAERGDRPPRWPAPGAAAPAARGPRAAVSSSMASTRVSPSTARRSLRAADQPIETWSSCIAELGMESTDAGAASRLSSETMAAWVYWAIICPESTPGSSARKGGRPWLRARSRNRSVRRSAMLARSATTMARKSST